MRPINRSSRYLAAVLTVAGRWGVPAASRYRITVTQLKDEASKTIVEYIVEAPS